MSTTTSVKESNKFGNTLSKTKYDFDLMNGSHELSEEYSEFSPSDTTQQPAADGQVILPLISLPSQGNSRQIINIGQKSIKTLNSRLRRKQNHDLETSAYQR